MDWTKNAIALMQSMEERSDFIKAVAVMPEEEIMWVNKHLDMAFAGRHDHLRTGAPDWVRVGSIPF